MRFWKVLAAGLVLGVAGLPASAQTPEIQKELEEKLRTERELLARERAESLAREQAPGKGQRELYEEIEILSRLLDRGLARHARLGVHSHGAPGEIDEAVAFSPDGKRLATASAGGVRVWDTETGKLISDHTGFNPHGVQGVYLKGQGIVCTISVPLHFHRKVVGGSDAPAPKTLTEWERIRKELRGEKVEGNKPKESDDISITDVILKVLADNGKNLTHLPDKESVTVAVTLAPVQACTKCHGEPFRGGGAPGMMGGPPGGMPGGMMPPGGGSGMPGGGAMRPGGPGGMGPPGGSGAPPGGGSFPPGGGGPPPGGGSFPPGGGSVPPGAGSGSPPPGGGSSGGPPAGGPGIGGGPGPDSAGDRAEFRKHALIGDLALKQQDYAKAVDAYQHALAATRNLRHDAETELELVEVASKCARALIALGKISEAEAMVQGIGKVTDRIGGGAGRPDKPKEAKPEMPLPNKLIIVVSKKALEAFASGGQRFDDFREAASVEYLTFDKPATEQPKGGASKP